MKIQIVIHFKIALDPIDQDIMIKNLNIVEFEDYFWNYSNHTFSVVQN
jgi:hypothetical protein